MTTLTSFMALSAFILISCGGSSNFHSYPAQPPTGAEEPLLKEVNKMRQAAGKKPLIRSPKLDALVASESTRLAATGSRKPNTAGLQKKAGLDRMAILVGFLKDRGPKTGAQFPQYWKRNEGQKSYLLGDWSRIGIGTAKSAEGDLIGAIMFSGDGT